MIKQLKKTNILLSPVQALKAWELFNTDNEDCVLLEPLSASVSIPDTTVALDYIDYLAETPILNRDCNIALEQQPEDVANYEDGVVVDGIFNQDTDPQNADGTYKRLVYNQIQKAFYNNYRNPVEIFGMENIDFPLSKTDRFLADQFRMFTIPQIVFGDKVSPGSIQFQDTALDDFVLISDDSNENLIAGSNLFSRVQEVRSMGNNIMPGTASYSCPTYSP